MPAFRTCSALVIRCFKRVEHFADWATGKAGPVFIFLCWTLIILGGISFCMSLSSLPCTVLTVVDVVAQDMSWLALIVLSPVLVLVPLNLYGQYYLVTHVPPGYPSPRAMQRSAEPMSGELERRWLDMGERSLWKPERWGLYRKGRALSGRRDTSGRIQSVNGRHGLEEGKRVRRCRKCDGPKPEVSRGPQPPRVD